MTMMALTRIRRRRSCSPVNVIPPLLLLLMIITITVLLCCSSSVMGFFAPTISSSRVPSTLITDTIMFSSVTATNTRKRILKKRTAMIFASSVDDVNDEAKSDDNDADKTVSSRKSTGFSFWYKIPQAAYRVYTGYAKQLWTDTDCSARSKIANDRVAQTIRDMQHVLNSEYATKTINIDTTGDGDSDSDGNVVVIKNNDEEISTSNGSSSSSNNKSEEAKDLLLKACDNMLTILDENNENEKKKNKNDDKSSTSTAVVAVAAPKKTPVVKKQRSVLFGALMGLTVAGWVFSGNYIFTGLFSLITILGQLEYYRMIMNTGVFPARRISVIGATSMFVTALFAPDLHQLCLPMFGLWAMIWKLTMRRKISTISEIATTFTGMFYLGYVPSFWVRIRTIGSTEMMEPTRLFPVTLAMRTFLKKRFDFLVPKTLVHLPITSGAVFIFWSWISLAFSDVGAYFVGRKYGKTKLGAISPAMGETSPNKSVEGVIGGCIASSLFSIAGAWAQKWPHFVLTGAIHGTILALLGLIGDLNASMLKRDAGLKDFGNLIPEHGGIMDRVDSFIWTAPYSFLVINFILPALKSACK